MDAIANTVRPIPLDALRVSPLNARRTQGESVEALAANIRTEGLLQNLTVVESEDGTFEIVCGMRRFGALQLLRERGELPGGLEAPACLVVDADRATSASLAENTMRAAMHPADEFEAFARLVADGKSIEDIAQEFGTLPVVVHRRLKLAAVAPSLFAQFRENKITLEQMMALALTDDHGLQEQAWNVRDEWKRRPDQLRAALTKAEIRISQDTAAAFVGGEALAAAGITVRGDLFSDTFDGYVPAKARRQIDELALVKLEAIAEQVKLEGWSWVKAQIELSWEERNQLRQVESSGKSTLSADEKVEHKALSERVKDLQERHSERSDVEERELVDAINRLAVLQGKRQPYAPDQYAAAGAFVTLSRHRGALEILRGQVKPGDRKPKEKKKPKKGAAGKAGEASAAPAELSGPMRDRLRAQRTAILQAALLKTPNVAVALLADALIRGMRLKLEAGDSQYAYRGPVSSDSVSCVQFDMPTDGYFATAAPELDGMPHRKAALHAREALQVIPEDDEKVLPWLLEQQPTRVWSILAVLGALSANTYSHDIDATDSELAALMAATAHDPADDWTATRATFFDHVPRAIALDVVREACGQTEAAKLEGMKKAELAEAAELQLRGKRWLPQILRAPGYTTAAIAPAAKGAPSTSKEKPTKAVPVARAKPAAKGKPTPAAKKTGAKPKAKSKPAAKAKARGR